MTALIMYKDFKTFLYRQAHAIILIVLYFIMLVYERKKNTDEFFRLRSVPWKKESCAMKGKDDQ